MPKLHVSLNVNDWDQSVRFYSTLFGVTPAKHKPDYVKFELDDPAVVLTLEKAPAPVQICGVSHLGVRLGSSDDVDQAAARLRAAGLEVLEEKNTTCCYAVQDKIWVADPTGYRWELYTVKGDSDRYCAEPTLCCATAETECCDPAQTACC
jgi:catechol 2,3-dioxygenase-like lactoylglutathione lyase family enzyme